MNPNDSELIAQVRAGNVRSYSTLVNRHKDKAFTLAVRLIGSRHEAEELVQDAFVRAFRNLDSFRGDAKFTTWFYRIVYNLCMTQLSRKRAQPTYADVVGEDIVELLVDDEPSFDEQLDSKEMSSALREEVENMPDHLKTVVTLFYVQDMSYEEICDVVRLPLGTVKTHLFRARTMLRKMMQRRFRGELAQ